MKLQKLVHTATTESCGVSWIDIDRLPDSEEISAARRLIPGGDIRYFWRDGDRVSSEARPGATLFRILP